MQPTNPEQFTEKAWEAIAKAPEIVKQAKQQNLESEHLLLALLNQEGLASSIFNKAEMNVTQVRDRATTFMDSKAKLAAAPESVYLGKSMDKLLDRAEQHRKSFGDEFISTEHLILSYASDARLGKSLFAEFGLNESKLKAVIEQIRGNQKVTDQNPERQI